MRRGENEAGGNEGREEGVRTGGNKGGESE